MTSEVSSFGNGRYQVLRKLGEGGKGVVFLCQDTVLRRQVAIKLLKEEGLDSEGLLRFQREVQAMASLVHPNVVTVFDIGQEGARHCLVLEFMEGGDVEHFVTSAPNQRLDAATAVRIGKEVARALEHAHSHGILHRDVKPGNVWLTTRSSASGGSGQAQGVAKLGDFGLAYLGGSPRLTQAGMMVGSIAYMAPEVALGRTADARLKIAVTPPTHETNDPGQTTNTGSWQLSPMYEYLLRVTPAGEIAPMLATDYTISPDAKTWTINLRKGVPWQGFRPGSTQGNWGEFTAKDLVHSLQAITKDGVIAATAKQWRTLLELPQKTDRIEVVSDYQVKLHLTRPNVNLHHLLSSQWELLIVSKAQFDSAGPEGWAKKPVGTGPYEFVERKLGQSLLYQRSAGLERPGAIEGKHWRVTPDFAELQLFFVPEDATRLAMLLTGEAHITAVSPDAERQASQKGMKVVLSTLPSFDTQVVLSGNYLPTAPQYKPEVPWTRKGVREAMNRAVNRPELRDALFGGRGDLLLVDKLHPSLPGWNPEWPRQFEKSYGYDPARAKALLQEAGYPQGFKVDLIFAPRPGFPQIGAVAEAIGNYWRAIGLDVKITQYEYATLRDQSRKSNLYDPWVFSSGYQLDAAQGFPDSYYSKSDVHHFFHSAVIDQKHEELSASTDLGQRDRLLREIGDLLFSEYTGLPLFWVNASFIIDPRIVAEYTTAGLYWPKDMEYIKAVR